MTSVIALNDGALIRSSSKTVDFGGGDITRGIMAEHGMRSYLQSTRTKEKWYGVPLEDDDVLSAAQKPAIYRLPDGTDIELGQSRMALPLHSLFAVKANGHQHGGNESARINAPFLVKECLERSRLDLSEHLVLSGGGTMMKGFAERFSTEIKLQITRKTAVKIERNRVDLAWIGGSVLSQFSSFKDRKLVTKTLYKERGNSIVDDVLTL